MSIPVSRWFILASVSVFIGILFQNLERNQLLWCSPHLFINTIVFSVSRSNILKNLKDYHHSLVSFSNDNFVLLPPACYASFGNIFLLYRNATWKSFGSDMGAPTIQNRLNFIHCFTKYNDIDFMVNLAQNEFRMAVWYCLVHPSYVLRSLKKNRGW